MWIELPQISLAARTAACSICGSNVPEVPALTSNVFIEHEGDIEVCQRCIMEGGAIYGMHTDEEVKALQAAVDELQAYSDQAYQDLLDKQHTIETISRALAETAAQRDAILFPVTPE
jgi:hypothetical protein